MFSEVLIVILGVILILLIIYIYIKETEFNRKFKIVASKIDLVNRQIFTMNKNFSKELELQKQDIGTEIETFFNNNNVKQNEEISKITHLEEHFENLKRDLEELKTLNSRVLTLETGLKNAVLNRNSSVDKSQQIISLHKTGKSIEDISRELHISRTEVEFALKLAKLV
jgi:hypothetical protein